MSNRIAHRGERAQRRRSEHSVPHFDRREARSLRTWQRMLVRAARRTEREDLRTLEGQSTREALLDLAWRHFEALPITEAAALRWWLDYLDSFPALACERARVTHFAPMRTSVHELRRYRHIDALAVGLSPYALGIDKLHEDPRARW